MAKNYTPIPNEYLYTMEFLSDEEYGRLMRWCQAYYATGEEDRVELKGNERLFQRTCAAGLDRASESYEKRCRASRKNGSLGGRPRKKAGASAEEYGDSDPAPEKAGELDCLTEDPAETGEGEPDGRSENPEGSGKPAGFSGNPEKTIEENRKEENRIEKNRIEERESQEEKNSPAGGADAVSASAGGGKNDTGGGAEERFAHFWKAYPRKVGKQAAQRAWNRLGPDEALTEEILSAVEKQKGWEQWSREGGRYIPNPATWLNQGRWEDEPPAQLEKGGRGNGDSGQSGAGAETEDSKWHIRYTNSQV